MAKLRSNHQKRKGPFSGLLLRVLVMFGIIAIFFVGYWQMANSFTSEDDHEEGAYTNESAGIYEEKSRVLGEKSPLIPEGPNVEIVEHKYYTLGYAEKYEQAAWVSYKLTKESLRIPNVQRAKRFEIDNAVSTRSAAHSDYSGSGYSRGHMAPAGDMAFSTEAMNESMFMSNMSPQKIPFNGGIWRELEETVRDWAYENEEVYIVTGPVLNDITKYIGKRSKVAVPDAHYKVIVDLKGREKKGIGFIMPNEVSDRPIMDYVMTIDEVERVTGIDFYANLITDRLEQEVESTLDLNKWPVSNKRQNNRINSWNKNK